MALIIIYLGIVFKAMHWPGGDAMIGFGAVLLVLTIIAILITLLILRRKKPVYIPGKGMV